MGFFSWVCNAAKSAVKKGYEKGKELCSRVGNAVTNTWNKFTGKSTYDEANELYKKIKLKYDNKRLEFEKEVDKYTNLIERHVYSINSSKDYIKSTLFVRTANNLERIHDVKVDKDFAFDIYKNVNYNFDQISSKEKLFKIDFDKHKFKTNVLAVFTLGFATRKKAKETLYAVQEEEAKINTEIAKMDAEITKLKVIENSLENVEIYFKELIDIYEKMLVRLENNVNYLLIRCLSLSHKLIKTEMSIRRLPEIQRKEIESIVTISKILKTMVETNVLEVEKEQRMKSYSYDIQLKYKDVKQVYAAS